jgi:hypothetical protein
VDDDVTAVPVARRARAPRWLAIVFIMTLCACDTSDPQPFPSSTLPLPRPSETPDGVLGQIVPVARMSSPRAVQSSTRLWDGTVLIAGGCSDPGCELGSAAGSTAEVFDPTTETFSAVGDLGGFRDDHSAILLGDGRVLLAGGWGPEGVLESTELYEPGSRTFSAGPSMTTPRAGFTAVPLADGRILLAGGFLDNAPTTAAADLFDPSRDAITRTGSLREPRGAYAAARLPDGRVLIAGGLSNGGVVASAETYDPRTGAFERTGAMDVPRYKSAAVTLADGTVMVIGGAADVEGTRLYATTEIYDPERGTFSPGPKMRWPRYKLAGSVVSLPDGSILVAGGAAGAERFNPNLDRFEEVPGDLQGVRLFLASAITGRQSVLLTGGYDDQIVPTDQAWLYRPNGR